MQRWVSFAAFIALAGFLALIPSPARAFLDLGSDAKLQEPPEPPEPLLTQPAFASAAPPAVKWIVVSGEQGWPADKILRKTFSVRKGLPHALYDALDASSRKPEIEGYQQTMQPLGGTFTVFRQSRESSNESKSVQYKASTGRVTGIRSVSGALFPLKVGNRLTVEYTWRTGEEEEKTFRNEWRVTREERASNTHPKLAGRVFVIAGTVNGQFAAYYKYSEMIRHPVSWIFASGHVQTLQDFALTSEGEALAARLREEDQARAREAEAARAREISALQARSAGLPPEERARAQNLFKQAFALFQSGEFAAAAEGFRRGLEIDPANGLGHFYFAETLARQEQALQAIRHYERAMALTPDSKEALLARSRLPELAPLAKWIGKWRTPDGSILEIKLSGKNLVMVWAKPAPKMAEYGFRPGDVRLSGSLKGSSLEGKEIDRWGTPEARRCYGDGPEKPMSATLSADGRIITAQMTSRNLNFNPTTCAINSSSDKPLTLKFLRIDE